MVILGVLKVNMKVIIIYWKDGETKAYKTNNIEYMISVLSQSIFRNDNQIIGWIIS